jgi:hypothetical protein
VLGVGIAMVAAFALRRHPAALIGWVVGVVAMLGFVYAKYFGFLRHHGHLWLLLLALLWINGRTASLGSSPSKVGAIGRHLFTALLALHVLAAVYIGTVQIPFSASRAVAEYIRAEHPPDVVIAGDPHYVVSSVAGCLDKPLYYPATGSFGTYVVWDDTLPLDYPEVQRRTLELARKVGRPVLLLTNYLLPAGDRRFEQIAMFDQSVVPDEIYAVYRVTPD